MLIILILSTFFLAYANGANDNFKGVATLFGSASCSYKTALLWATATTFLGGIAAIFFAQELIVNFSGKGILSESLMALPIYGSAIVAGAAITVFVATKLGMPISTTHALVGALTGIGLIANNHYAYLYSVLKLFVLPLLIGPILSTLLSFMLYKLLNYVRIKTNITKEYCICIDNNTDYQSYESKNQLMIAIKNNPTINSCNVSEHYTSDLFGITAQKVVKVLHFLSAGLVCFARGLNDVPKIIAILLITNVFDFNLTVFVIVLTMCIGGLINAKKVAFNMSKNITHLNEGQGFTANIVTGILTTIASLFGMPVSTTHASVGAIFGIAYANKNANLKMFYSILTSWIFTLPIAAVLTGLVYYLLNLFL